MNAQRDKAHLVGERMLAEVHGFDDMAKTDEWAECEIRVASIGRERGVFVRLGAFQSWFSPVQARAVAAVLAADIRWDALLEDGVSEWADALRETAERAAEPAKEIT